MKYDILIIGGGVTGAAIARALSRYSLSVTLLEAREDLARGASGANSGIVHAGYDPKPGSLMARYNVKGCAMYPALCHLLDVPYRNTGSLMLAFSKEQMQLLEKLYRRGRQNGVPNLEILGAESLRRKEPAASGEALGALYAPTAGVVSPYEMTIALAENAAENGVTVRLSEAVTAITPRQDGFSVQTTKGELTAAVLINCAGARAGRSPAAGRRGGHRGKRGQIRRAARAGAAAAFPAGRVHGGRRRGRAAGAAAKEARFAPGCVGL